jgi:hypothetical protein
MITWF